MYTLCDSIDVLKCICDSAATEHIILDPKWLCNAKMVTSGTIRSANKNSQANLKVERVGEMVIKDYLGRIIKLNRVLQTKDVSKNLLSLRRLVNNGMKINLNAKSIEVIENQSNRKVLDGIFDSTLWNIDLNVMKVSGSKLIQKNNDLLTQLSCRQIKSPESQANIIENNKVQSNTVGNSVGSKNKVPSFSCQKVCSGSFMDQAEEVDRAPPMEVGPDSGISMIRDDHTYSKQITGSQTACKNASNVSEDQLNNITELYDEFGFKHISSSQGLENYKQALDEIKLGQKNERAENLRKNLSLLWHIRLGHVSKTYLKKASKYIEELKNIKFTDDLLECPVYIKSKAVKKPSTSVRF